MEFKLPKRPQNSHKGSFGKVLNIAGCLNYSGAAFLSSISALKIGAGLVALSAPKEVIQSVAAQTPNVIFLIREETLEKLNDFTVVSIGCGLGEKPETEEFFKTILDKLIELEKPTVIDASGLNILANLDNKKLPPNFVLTPHPAEAARLLNTDVENIVNKPDLWTIKLAEKYGCVCLIKGMNTRVYKQGHEIYINNSGCSALAKAGSGDVLTGMIAGLIAQGMDSFEATKTAVYFHGKTGEKAAEILGEHGVLASDLIKFI